MLRRSLAAATAVCRRPGVAYASYRLYSPSVAEPQPLRQVAQQMIQYALGHARSQRTEDSYSQALLVLEQGVTSMQAAGGETGAAGVRGDEVGMLLLAMSSLLYERGEIGAAVDKLQMVRELSSAASGIKVAALEGLIGVHLEAGKDDTSSVIADECLRLSEILEGRLGEADADDVLRMRCNSLRGFVDLVLGDVHSAALRFTGSNEFEFKEGKKVFGNIALAYGEFLHATGNTSLAYDFYHRALHTHEENIINETCVLSSANMVPEEVRVAAACALGQLLSHAKKFDEAESMLTRALTQAEKYFGANNPKVAMILTCLAGMYGHKAKLEKSSSLLIQEGLYRRALDLLKAPSLEMEDPGKNVSRRDIIALARGGYAEALCVQQNRKSEGERLKQWARSAWRNRRLSLAEALEFSEDRMVIVDTRIGRAV